MSKTESKPTFAFNVYREQDNIREHPEFIAEIVDIDPAGRMRNLADHSEHGREFADLQVWGLVERDDKIADRVALRVWWWKIEYRRPYRVDTERAAAMLRVLRKVENGLAKAERKFGPPDSFASYLTRVADVLGITEYRVKVSGDHWTYDGNEYRALDGAGIAYWLHQQLNPPTVTTRPDGTTLTVIH